MGDTFAHTKKRKKGMIKALREHKGLVTYACEAAGVGRSTHYDWLREDPEYKKEVDAVEDLVLDFIENSSVKMIEEGKTPAMNIFYLKTKGKRRGFVEKQEIEVSTGDMTSLRNVIKECDDNDEYEKDY